MGKKQSKPEPEPAQQEDQAKNDLWELSRNFGSKYYEFHSALEQQIDQEKRLARERFVRPSTYFPELPAYQGFLTRLAVFALFFRKLPFTNPAVRVVFMLMGFDYIRSGAILFQQWTDTDRREIQCFDRMNYLLRVRQSYRKPDFVNEFEDWYDMNKPAYRVPVPHEYTMDSWMRYFAVNRNQFKNIPVQWNGDWEQELFLNMDLHAPHADHWLDIH